MSPPVLETCSDCGVVLPAGTAASHSYLGASSSCWSLYGMILAREFSDPAYMRVHRMTVDAYCAQHPGAPERRAIQSINVHLAGLYITVEKRLSGDFARKVIGALIAHDRDGFRWLAPPADLGKVRVVDIISAEDADAHGEAVEAWGASVWSAWSAHHAHIFQLTERAMLRL